MKRIKRYTTIGRREEGKNLAGEDWGNYQRTPPSLGIKTTSEETAGQN